VRRLFRRARPTSCLVIEVAGLEEFAVLYSDSTVWHVLKMIGGAIASNVRPFDVVCRSGASRFAVGLVRCPAPDARLAGERIAANVSRLVLRGVNQGYGTQMQLRWSSATMPRDATTPIQLLHVTEHSLDQAPIPLPAERRRFASRLR
jgi:GGDEF domain-containing protein